MGLGNMYLNELFNIFWNFIFNALNTENVPFLWLKCRLFTTTMINLN